MDVVVLADAARAAGTVAGRLLVPFIGVIVIVVGMRLRRDPRRAGVGTAVVVAGVLVAVLSLAGTVAAAAQA